MYWHQRYSKVSPIEFDRFWKEYAKIFAHRGDNPPGNPSVQYHLLFWNLLIALIHCRKGCGADQFSSANIHSSLQQMLALTSRHSMRYCYAFERFTVGISILISILCLRSMCNELIKTSSLGISHRIDCDCRYIYSIISRHLWHTKKTRKNLYNIRNS